MSRDLDQALHDHFAARESAVSATPFNKLFEHQPRQFKRGFAAIAASVLVVGLSTLLWINQEEVEPDPLFAEITSTVMWRAPSDRITQQGLKLDVLRTPNLQWPDNKVTRLGALEEIKL